MKHVMLDALRTHDDRMWLIDVAWAFLPWEHRLCSFIRHTGAPRIELSGEFYCIRCCKTVTRDEAT